MGEYRRKAGDALHLRLALDDGKTNRYVRAWVYDENNTLMYNVALAHLYDGVYGENTLTMPQKNHLTAKFKVFKDAGFTKLDSKYSQEIDTFDLDLGRVLINNQHLDAEMSALELDASVMESSLLDADQYAPELESNFSTNEPTAEVTSNQTDASVGGQELDGEITTC